jgi:hypothetical protein
LYLSGAFLPLDHAKWKPVFIRRSALRRKIAA